MNDHPETGRCLNTIRILATSNSVERCAQIGDTLSGDEYAVTVVGSLLDSVVLLEQRPFDVWLIDCAVVDGQSIEPVALPEKCADAVPILLLASSETQADKWRNTPVSLRLKAAALDVIEVPLTKSRLAPAIRIAAKQSSLLAENLRLKRRLSNSMLQDLPGRSPQIQILREQVRLASENSASVLIECETGADPGNVANAIHKCSLRAHRPFIQLNCEILTATSLEQELFGSVIPFEPTGGVAGDGRLAAAAGGTLFLENIDGASLSLQRKFSRMLQPSSHLTNDRALFERLDIKLIASRSINCSVPCARTEIREELLNILQGRRVQIPALRQRRDDIAVLVEHFLVMQAAAEGKPVRAITVEALKLLQNYDWPGNERELKNVLERACSIDNQSTLSADAVRPWLSGAAEIDIEGAAGLTLREMERKLIETTFARCGGNHERTAKSLEIGLRTLSGKLRQYGYPPRGRPGSNKMSPQSRVA